MKKYLVIDNYGQGSVVYWISVPDENDIYDMQKQMSEKCKVFTEEEVSQRKNGFIRSKNGMFETRAEINGNELTYSYEEYAKRYQKSVKNRKYQQSKLYKVIQILKMPLMPFAAVIIYAMMYIGIIYETFQERREKKEQGKGK